MFNYLLVNCPNSDDGGKDVKGLVFLVCGKRVCQKLWLAACPSPHLGSTRFVRSSLMGQQGSHLSYYEGGE